MSRWMCIFVLGFWTSTLAFIVLMCGVYDRSAWWAAILLFPAGLSINERPSRRQKDAAP